MDSGEILKVYFSTKSPKFARQIGARFVSNDKFIESNICYVFV